MIWGMVYVTGGRKVNKIFSGDCLFVMRHDIPDESVDLRFRKENGNQELWKYLMMIQNSSGVLKHIKRQQN